MTDITKITNKRLAKLLEAQCDKNNKSLLAVFALSAHERECFREIVARLGADHKAVRASNADREKLEKLKSEARRRVGPVTFDLTDLYVAYLNRLRST